MDGMCGPLYPFWLPFLCGFLLAGLLSLLPMLALLALWLRGELRRLEEELERLEEDETSS